MKVLVSAAESSASSASTSDSSSREFLFVKFVLLCWLLLWFNKFEMFDDMFFMFIGGMVVLSGVF